MIKMKEYRGFTLIEMLVVVLIIGILAAIALPQYNKVVEKSRLAEALVNFKAIKGSMDRYLLTNGISEDSCASFDENFDVELSGGEWDEDDGFFITKDFLYEGNGFCGDDYIYEIDIHRAKSKADSELYTLQYRLYNTGEEIKSCIPNHNNMGNYICNYLESQGWE